MGKKIFAVVSLLAAMLFGDYLPAANRPGKVIFTVRAFAWRGTVITTGPQAVVAIRAIKDKEQAQAFIEAVRITNPDAEAATGYLGAYFQTTEERLKFEELFGVEHPILGAAREFVGLPSEMLYVLAYLGVPLSSEELNLVQQAARGITAAQAQHLLERIYGKAKELDLEMALRLLREEMKNCDSALSAAEPDQRGIS